MTWTTDWIDADPVWAQRGAASSDSALRLWVQSIDTWTNRFQRAWTAPFSDRIGGTFGHVELTTANGAATDVTNWMVTWVQATEHATTVLSGILPPEVTSDPNVVDVTWEPTSTFVDQRVRVVLANVERTGPPEVPEGDYSLVKLSGTARDEFPDYLTAATIAGKSTLAEIPRGETEAVIPLAYLQSVGVVGTEDPVIHNLMVTVIDHFTQTQTAPTQPLIGTPWRWAANFDLLIEALYPIRYKVTYADLPTTGGDLLAPRAHPVLRQLQRGGRGGIGGVPRLLNNPTRLDSPRRGPGSVY